MKKVVKKVVWFFSELFLAELIILLVPIVAITVFAANVFIKIELIIAIFKGISPELFINKFIDIAKVKFGIDYKSDSVAKLAFDATFWPIKLD